MKEERWKPGQPIRIGRLTPPLFDPPPSGQSSVPDLVVSLVSDTSGNKTHALLLESSCSLTQLESDTSIFFLGELFYLPPTSLPTLCFPNSKVSSFVLRRLASSLKEWPISEPATWWNSLTISDWTWFNIVLHSTSSSHENLFDWLGFSGEKWRRFTKVSSLTYYYNQSRV